MAGQTVPATFDSPNQQTQEVYRTMRFLSPHAQYGIQVFEGEEQVVVDARGYAQTISLKKPVHADFDRGGLLDHEIELALETFSFSGLPEGVSPLTRIGVFDSEAYCQRFPENQRDEMQVQIDQRLVELHKIFPSQFIPVETPRTTAPWPSYDNDSVEDILKFQERLLIEPDRIRLYELENANRDEIVEAMLRQSDPAEAERLFGAEVESVGEEA